MPISPIRTLEARKTNDPRLTTAIRPTVATEP